MDGLGEALQPNGLPEGIFPHCTPCFICQQSLERVRSPLDKKTGIRQTSFPTPLSPRNAGACKLRPWVGDDEGPRGQGPHGRREQFGR